MFDLFLDAQHKSIKLYADVNRPDIIRISYKWLIINLFGIHTYNLCYTYVL